ncbi:GrpB family protein [Anaerobacillus alkalidiazotrophicus]|nr:GrpB family protein [Anaerobacillus alkalidiazotrophicus]
MRKVKVFPHKQKWIEMFQEESEKLKTVFKDELIHVYHIGSTAIPTIYAKPIVDIMVEVTNISKVDKFTSEMEELGYESHGEYGIPNRRFFSKGGDNRTHHVHIFEHGNGEIDRHLAFRDYMIAHPEEALKYSQLKQTLAEKFPTNIAMYIEGKNDYIKVIDKKASKLRRTN